MDIIEKRISVAELYEGFRDDQEEGVYGYKGLLNIRPKYQREFIYNARQQEAVIESIQKKRPLNVMYWVENPDGTFELLDGQQRTMSICTYIGNGYMADWDGKQKGFSNLTESEKQRLLDYELSIYICQNGTDRDVLDWFETINIAGERLNKQEVRNAVYSGIWVQAAKRFFSRSDCPAYLLGADYMNGVCIRQDYLQTVIGWISGGDITGYMAAHQHDTNADELWLYFQSVINWVKAKFPKKRKEMKSVQWGPLYNKYKDTPLDAAELEKEVARLMQDSDVKRQTGIYEYVLDGDVRHLDIRAFDGNTKRRVYEKQGGVCPMCGKRFELGEMEADHITPWKEGGHTVVENCQMLCRECNRRKGAR